MKATTRKLKSSVYFLNINIIRDEGPHRSSPAAASVEKERRFSKVKWPLKTSRLLEILMANSQHWQALLHMSLLFKKSRAKPQPHS